MFDLTRKQYEDLIDKLMLNEEMQRLLEYKIKGYTITKISILLNMSEATVNRRVKQLKKKIMKVI